MMNSDTLSPRNIFLFMAAFVAIAVFAYFYVASFALGYRAVFVMHGGAVLFLGCAIFLRNLSRFLLFAAVFCIPLQFGYHIIHQPVLEIESQPFVAGIRIDCVDVILVLLYAHWAVLISRDKGRRRVRFGHPIGTVLLIWIAYCFVSSFWTSVQLRYSIFEVIELLKGYLFYVYLVNNVSSKEDFLAVVYGLFASTVAHALYIVVQYITKMNYTVHAELVEYVGPEGFRSAGFFGSPDAASAFISIIFPVAVAYFVCFRGELRRLGTLVLIGLFGIAIMCTKVRATGFAVLISSVSILWICYLRGWMSSRRMTKLVLVGGLLLLLVIPFSVERFRTGTYGEDRIPLLLTAVNMFKEHAALGVGTNNYAFRVAPYIPLKMKYSWTYIVHNEYLLRLAETGVIGFLIYYFLILLVFIRLVQSTGSPDPWVFVVSAGLLAAMIGSLLHRMVSIYHYVSFFTEWCVIMAMAEVMFTFERERRAKASAGAKSGKAGRDV